ncbi:MAG: hypothetical protein EXR77_10750 [Myxococcales bacterium]|nr:hypothetical protein [Myxococcales bacterium]
MPLGLPVSHRSLLMMVMLLLLIAGCAAMRRTWQFSGPPLAAHMVAIAVDSAVVAQRRLEVTLKLTNTGPAAAQFTCDAVSVTLPDGEVFSGEISGLKADFSRKMLALGFRDENDQKSLPAGATTILEFSINQGHRDLRRHARLELRLPDLKIDGALQNLMPIILLAPPEAPIGEDI